MSNVKGTGAEATSVVPGAGLLVIFRRLGQFLPRGLEHALPEPVRQRDARVGRRPADEVIVLRQEADPDGCLVFSLLGLRRHARHLTRPQTARSRSGIDQ